MKYLIQTFILIIINSCSYPEIVRDELIYENNFENNNLDNIDGGGLSEFNNSTVIGDFNNDSFTIHLNDVGDHDYIFVSFDLYIHGSWDGNLNGFSNNDKPDLWAIELNPGLNPVKDLSNDRFVTTFSNSVCFPNYCLRQSYPEPYPFQNNPKTGIYKTSLPEFCQNSLFSSESSSYKIEKGFRSSGNAIVLKFYDELYQPNAIDKDGLNMQKCDESWSIDNIKIRAIKYQWKS